MCHLFNQYVIILIKLNDYQLLLNDLYLHLHLHLIIYILYYNKDISIMKINILFLRRNKNGENKITALKRNKIMKQFIY